MCNWDVTIKKGTKSDVMLFFWEHNNTVIETISLFTTFVNGKDILSCSSEIWNAVFVCIIAYVANLTVWWEVFCSCMKMRHCSSTSCCDKMFSKADGTSQTVYHDWYLQVKYVYMLLANTSVVSSVLLFSSPISDIVNISCIDNELGFNSSKVLLCQTGCVIALFPFYACLLWQIYLKGQLTHKKIILAQHWYSMFLYDFLMWNIF